MRRGDNWPEIKDPAARSILKALSDDTPGVVKAPRLHEEYLKPRPWAGKHLVIRNQLAQSGLAQSIAKGMSDRRTLHDSLPALAGALLSPFAPRSPAAMAVHVARNLEWYLKPPERIGAWGTIPFLWRYIGISWAALFTLFARRMDDLPDPLIVAAFLFFAVIGVLWLYAFSRGLVVGQGVENINKTEFYWYMLDYFRDAEAAAAEPAAAADLA